MGGDVVYILFDLNDSYILGAYFDLNNAEEDQDRLMDQYPETEIRVVSISG